MLSIIIPVYNTEKFIGKCLESILDQDYKDYEVIVVNDGSTDSSLDVINAYASTDSRIIVLSKKNEGQGIARNVAIEKAKGEMLLFVDSDDWIPEKSLSVMINCFEKTNADVVIGNGAQTFIDEENIRRINKERFSGIMSNEDIKNNIFEISGAPWAKLIRKSLFIQNEIRFPDIYFEDLATIPLLYAMSNKIAFVDECVYVQRMNSGSTVHRIENIYDRIYFVDKLIQGFKKIGKYEEYHNQINNYLIKRAQINLRMVRSLCNKTYIDYATTQKNEWLTKYGIDTTFKKRAYCFGSYNLMIVTKIFMQIEDSGMVEDYFGCSSLISAMSPQNSELNKISICHENEFRRTAIIRDFEKKFYNLNPGNFYNYDYFFLDFLEERFDIGVYKGEYFTLSEAFLDISRNLKITYGTIKAFSDVWWDLWRKSCSKFVDKLRAFVGDKKVVLIRSFLSEKKYIDDLDNDMYFENIDLIKDVNDELLKCYAYFQALYPEALVIDVIDLDVYKTDGNFKHGSYPWHLSASAYGTISKTIEMRINELNSKRESL